MAAGFEIRTAAGLRAVIRSAEETLGLSNVPVIHSNHSKTPLGSRVDRHEHIGKGHIGMDAFRRILRHPKLRGKAFIMETPVEREGDDRRNLERLQALAARRLPNAMMPLGRPRGTRSDPGQAA